ncbi:MAG: DUF1835 domain-containing protein [Alistipes sp.]|nr:DUF1835 domain-containing protein [Alistipes sp.]
MCRLHIVYGESGAATLRLALSDLGLQDIVVSFPEVLQYAPLFTDFTDSSIRDYALRCCCMQVAKESVAERVAKVISTFVNADFGGYDKVVLWCGETAGDRLFGYMTCALVGRELSVVDLAPLRDVLPNPNVVALSMAHCSVDNLKMLLGGIKPLSESEKSANAEQWSRWSKSVADLRLISDGGEIVEADRQIFDNVILSASRGEWQSAARVVGRVLCKIDFVVGDSFLHRRIVELAGEGKILVRQREGVLPADNTLAQSLYVRDVNLSELRLFDLKAL